MARRLIAALAVAAASLACGLVLAGSAAAQAAPQGADFFVAPPAGQDIPAPPGADPRDAADVATTWADLHPSSTGLARTGADLEVKEVERAGAGLRVVRMQQEVRGIPVVGAETVVSVKPDGDIASVTGERLGGPTPTLTPGIAAADARRIAITDLATRYRVNPWGLMASVPEKVIFEPGIFGAPSPERSFLAWRVQVSGRDLGIEDTVLVHAHDGYSTVIPRTPHLRDRWVCNGNNVVDLKIPCTAGTASRVEGAGASGDSVVDTAYTYLGAVINYFFTVFGRSSFDGQGTAVPITVRGCPDPSPCPWFNAHWSWDSNNANHHMVVGDGYVGDDVIAHEFTHGVTQTTAALYYWYQSGAVNESMSDVLGEFSDMVDGVGGDTAGQRWQHAEERTGGYNRLMSDPPVKSQPDRTGSALYASDASDNGGVHTNSGVGNKAAYLITDGGTFNGKSVVGIGQTKAQQIYYRALTTLLRSGSDYQDLRVALNTACADLAAAGSFGITLGNCTQVDTATLATEMQLVPAQAPGTEATACPVGQVASFQNGILDDIETTGTVSSVATSGDASTFLFRPGWYATSGTKSLLLRALATATDGSLLWRPNSGVVIPPGAYMSFDHAYWLQSGVDGGVVEFSVWANGAWGSWTSAMGLVDSGYAPGVIGPVVTSLANQSAFTGTSRGYGSSRLNLASLSGQTVRFRFRIATDSSVAAQGWFIDDIGVYQCGAADVVAPETTITVKPAAYIRAQSAAFSFTADEAGSTFQCSIDGAAFTTCTSPKSYTGLTVGTHQFLVRARDAAGNVDSTPATWDFTVDLTPPDTSFTSVPPAVKNGTSATVAFTSPDGTATFKCARTGLGPTACTSPYTWSGLTDGTYTLTAQAVDLAGNEDSTPATTTVRIDNTAPTASFVSAPAAYVASTSVSIAMTSNEIATGVTFECKLDSGAYGGCTSPRAYTGLSQGSHTVTIRATDRAGNVGSPASTSFTVDTVLPDTSITSGPAAWINTSTATVGFTATEAAQAFQCRLDSAAWATCTSPKAYTGLVEGAYLISVRAVDLAGNIDPTPATRSFRVDTTNPDTVLISAPDPLINTTSATIAFAPVDANDTLADCNRDAAAWASCTSPWTVTGLTDGVHTLGARARDSATNVDLSPVYATFTVDRTAPTTTITSGPSGTVGSADASFGFTSNDSGASFDCSLDGEPYVGCDAPFEITDLTDGPHQFEVRATDLAGNGDQTPASRSFTVDTTEPTTTITDAPDESILASAASVSMTADEPVARFECALDSGAFSTCSSPHAFTGLAVGDHELSVRAVDLVGNVESSPQVVYVSRDELQAAEPELPPEDEGGGDGGQPDPSGDPAGDPGSSGAPGTGPGGGASANSRPTAATSELARANAELQKALAACGKRPPAQRKGCEARARATYAYAVAKARATSTRTAAKARCAKVPAARRAACNKAADAAYARAMAAAARARATALRRAG
ncbi:MAG: M4 family metallopeptidase [Acidobacteria bacterium]|nr:M4 family metallopeptidase [Acidobacteriota bacterium]